MKSAPTSKRSGPMPVTTAPGTPEQLTRVLVVVHPGSCCGSAADKLGSSLSSAYRDNLAADLDQWSGPLLILDGDLSDELPDYPRLDQALTAAQGRSTRSIRRFACDDVGEHFTTLLPKVLGKSPWNDPSKFRFDLTGAWYFADDTSGCVNAVADIFMDRGFKVDVLDSAFHDPDGNWFED